jgi:hypothetical protein
MIWPLGKFSKASPTPKGEYKQLLRMVTMADASVRLRHSVANSHDIRKGSQEVTIVTLTAHNGHVRGNRSQLFAYPKGIYCEKHGPENTTLMDSTGTHDTHSRAVSI